MIRTDGSNWRIPIFPHPAESIAVERHLLELSEPKNLRINQQIRSLREKCREVGCEEVYHHFAFGQSPFPPPPTVVAALARHAGRHSYLPTAGLPALREAVAAFHQSHFDTPCQPDQVLITPGSKQFISLVLAAVQGDVLIPTPAWVSYMPQARILKKHVIPIRLRREDGYLLTAEALERGLARCRHRQRILILNHPNNPTGAVYSRHELEQLTDVCRRNRVVVLADEIYALTAFDSEEYVSFGAVYPEGSVISTGLSKDRSCGGYRLGVGIFPRQAKELFRSVLTLAGSSYSCVAAPIQYAALEAYSGNSEVEQHMRTCRQIHSAVGSSAAEWFSRLPGVKTTVPKGAFYLFVDFNEYSNELRKLGFESCNTFAQDLMQKEHTAILPGDALLLPADDFSARCSYVDYDGGQVLETWRRSRPSNPAQRERFIREHCPLIPLGVERIGRYFRQVRDGLRPEHP